MNIKKIIAIIASTALTATLLASCGSSSSGKTAKKVIKDGKELSVLRVANMTGQPDQYADYIGMEQGIFEKYGISLETSEYAAGINTVDAIATGTADTGLLADFAAVNRIGNTLDNTNLVFFSDLSSSVSYNGGLFVAPKYKDDLDALDAHNGEASAAIVTGSAIKKYEAEGWTQVASAKDIGINVSAYLITSSDFAKNNTETLTNYLKALDESVKYINDNLDESAEKISKKYGIEPDDFKTNWEQYSIKLGLSEEAASHLDEINKWAYENGKYPNSYNIREFYYPDAAKKAFPDNVTADLTKADK